MNEIKKIYYTSTIGGSQKKKEEIAAPAYQLMWESNLKSRNSFLMMLEFLPLSRVSLKSMMSLLKPGGDGFFD
jgi:hypothetical protein